MRLLNAVENFMVWAKAEHADTCSGIVEKNAEHELAELMRRINFWPTKQPLRIVHGTDTSTYRSLAEQINGHGLDELRSFMAARKATHASSASKSKPKPPPPEEEELSGLEQAMPEFKDPFEEEKKRQEEEAARRAAEPKPEKVYGDKWGDW